MGGEGEIASLIFIAASSPQPTTTAPRRCMHTHPREGLRGGNEGGWKQRDLGDHESYCASIWKKGGKGGGELKGRSSSLLFTISLISRSPPFLRAPCGKNAPSVSASLSFPLFLPPSGKNKNLCVVFFARCLSSQCAMSTRGGGFASSPSPARFTWGSE